MEQPEVNAGVTNNTAQNSEQSEEHVFEQVAGAGLSESAESANAVTSAAPSAGEAKSSDLPAKEAAATVADSESVVEEASKDEPPPDDALKRLEAVAGQRDAENRAVASFWEGVTQAIPNAREIVQSPAFRLWHSKQDAITQALSNSNDPTSGIAVLQRFASDTAPRPDASAQMAGRLQALGLADLQIATDGADGMTGLKLAQDYPELAQFLMAGFEAQEKRFQAMMQSVTADATRRKAILSKHADYDRVISDTAFQEWKGRQSPGIQAMYEQGDPDIVAVVLDAYKSSVARPQIERARTEAAARKKQHDDIHQHTASGGERGIEPPEGEVDEEAIFVEAASKR